METRERRWSTPQGERRRRVGRVEVRIAREEKGKVWRLDRVILYAETVGIHCAPIEENLMDATS